MVFYEVGTYEQHEEGFHAFFRTRFEDKAEQVKAWAEEYQSKTPKWPTDEIEENQLQYMDLVQKLDDEFSELIGKKFSISNYSKELYSILINKAELDD
ncbi:hypothetical protein ODQ17_17035 [Acinetobacter sp. IRS14]|uniref:hypothetical protein n=1 Tax=Acinetobacter sp. IRS14 TaxID=2983398 RepID=UPI002AFEA585|nr:hypothetical protein [Acinetobacter sp. IRS14]MEA1231081.1 hypothetical protein [Acinetobacter sp. IRS14]